MPPNGKLNARKCSPEYEKPLFFALTLHLDLKTSFPELHDYTITVTKHTSGRLNLEKEVLLQISW